MSWTRLDDGWTKQAAFLDLAHEIRWHYLCMVEYCSAHDRYDGVLRPIEAQRCSDVLDVMDALAQLCATPLIEKRGENFAVVDIDRHVPPPHLRDEARKQRQRDDTRRHRAHRAGDHSSCRPEKCTKVSPVSTEVSAYTGTGQDGSGQELPPVNANGVGQCRTCGEREPLSPDRRCPSCVEWDAEEAR